MFQGILENSPRILSQVSSQCSDEYPSRFNKEQAEEIQRYPSYLYVRINTARTNVSVSTY